MAGAQRLRVFLAEYGRLLGVMMVVAAVLVLVGGLLVYTGAPTETVKTETNQQTIAGSHDIQVTVENDTDAYEEGTVLENQPVYLTPANNEAEIKIGVDAPSGTETTVTTVVRYQATYEDESTPFYTDERVLRQTTAEPGEKVSTTVDTQQVRTREAALEEEFGPRASVEVQAVTLIGYDTETYTGTLEVASPMSFPTKQTYRVQPAESQAARVTEEEVTQVDNSRTIANTPIQTNLVSSIFLALVIAGAGAVSIRANRVLSVEKERAELEATRYDEFITSVNGPISCPRPTETVHSVGELVKYAKTTGEQVLSCQTTGVFIIVNDDHVIMYDPEHEGEDGRVDELWNSDSGEHPSLPNKKDEALGEDDDI